MWLRYIGISFLHLIGWQVVKAALLLYAFNYLNVQGDALMLAMWASACIVAFPFAVFAFHVRIPSAKAVIQYAGVHLAVAILMLFVLGFVLSPGIVQVIYSRELWGQWLIELLGIVAGAWYVRRRMQNMKGAEGLAR
jgi:hypothetical protein